ncbi:MAG: hypothetical protein WBX22_31880 [Silvibacterium sp.]|jgi:hypothetical protein
MMATTIKNYESILQVLGDTGCPFCSFMKNFQTSLMQETAQKQIEHFCNFHTWGIAATQRVASAVQLFLDLLAKQPASQASVCDICVLLRAEEDRRIREFLGCLQHKLVAQWMRSQAVLCVIHGTRLKQGASPVLAPVIDTIMERHRNQLIETLNHIRDEYKP